MDHLTKNQVAFFSARSDWNRIGQGSRRAILRWIGKDKDKEQLMAESPFDQLPTEIREALIVDWQEQNMGIL
jgi:hypothetical protein